MTGRPWVPLALFLGVVVALGVRVLPAWDHVATADPGVVFQGVDAWYHVRLIENTGKSKAGRPSKTFAVNPRVFSEVGD